jgi:hypothetical protein
MLTKDAASSSAAKLDALPFVIWGQERTEAALSLQKDLLAAYEQANRTWLARVQSEVALWSDLATKLAGTLTVSEHLKFMRSAFRSGWRWPLTTVACWRMKLNCSRMRLNNLDKRSRSHWAMPLGQLRIRRTYGNFAKFAAIRRASSLLSNLADERRPGCSSK